MIVFHFHLFYNWEIEIISVLSVNYTQENVIKLTPTKLSILFLWQSFANLKWETNYPDFLEYHFSLRSRCVCVFLKMFLIIKEFGACFYNICGSVVKCVCGMLEALGSILSTPSKKVFVYIAKKGIRVLELVYVTI